MRLFCLGFLWLSVGMLSGCSNVNFGIMPVEQKFSQNILYNNKVDILWVVDNSSSMQKHQERLNQEVPKFVEKLKTLKLDFQMGVVTTSVGYAGASGGQLIGTPKILNAKTKNLEVLLTQRVLAGEDGSNLEQGLNSMKTVLSPSYLTGEGAGFLRSEALLVIIALSDEDDFSVTDRATSFNTFSNFLDTIKPDHEDGTKSWIMNFIGVLSMTSQCRAYNDYSSVGEKYLDLVNYSGGVQSSICTDSLTTAVSNVRARITQILTDFKLSAYPQLDTLVVKLNGQDVPQDSTNGWSYHVQGNFIRFNGTSVPGAYDAISVNFTPGAGPPG